MSETYGHRITAIHANPLNKCDHCKQPALWETDYKSFGEHEGRGSNPEQVCNAHAKEFAAKGLIVLAIDVGESKKTVKRYLEAHPRGVPIVLMEDTNLAAMYQANAYPIYVVIDRDGFIVGTQRGAGGEEALRRLIARAGIESPDDDSDSN